MDFRQQQDQAKKNSAIIWLLYLVLLCISSSLVSYTLLMGVNLLELFQDTASHTSFIEKMSLSHEALFSSKEQIITFAFVASIALLIMVITTSFGFFNKSNGHKVAKAFGGERIEDKADLPLALRQALNIVDEQSLAANIPAPTLYLIPDKGINAFAAGKSSDTAIVAITQGALESFSRTQLSGVIAHEIGHIVNHDIKLNIRISAFVFGFTALFFLAKLLFRGVLYNRRMDGRAKILLIAIAAIIAIIGALTVLFGRILQAAMSRQREYLADASAVQFTRYPEGLIEAFEVMQGKGKDNATVENPNAKEYAHAFMFGMSGEIFATHPPLDKRIERLQGRKNKNPLERSDKNPFL